MTLPLSAPAYEFAPPLRYVQFPWRFLGTATFFLSAFAGLGALGVLAALVLEAAWLRNADGERGCERG